MAENEKQTTGELDPSKWDEAVAVTGRPQDTPEANTTFAERAAARAPKKAAAKAVSAEGAENKSAARKARSK